MLRSPISSLFLRGSALAAATLLLLVGACHNSSSSPPPAGIAPEPVVPSDGVLPGVVVTIEEVRGRTPGHIGVGDVLSVDFKVATDLGEPLELSTMARAAIMVSGPTSNYQRVIASQADVIARSKKRAVGAYTYEFAVAIPDKYLEPLNDTTALSEGELTGQPLIDGTYTVGMEIRKDYQIGDTLYRDPGNATRNFLLGAATTLEPREVVLLANCNKCHTELRAHGDNRNQITNCLLCHTAGAEDRNDPSVAGGTPGVAIDFKVMIHKIHSGKHLPSVLGVTTNPDGSRSYDATPQPYQIMGYGNSLNDFSTVTWPAWPSFFTPMPRDLGYTTLTSAQRSAEDTMRRGPSECNECHGDPDGDGPLGAPLQGDTIWAKPTITTCTSCHDDWVPSHAYTSNGSTMPPQADSAACTQCHRESGTPLDLVDAHRHPLVDANVAQGVVFEVASVTDIGNGNGRFEAGEKVEVTFQAKNNDGAVIAASSLSRIETLLTGPTVNPQLLNYQRIPTDLFVGNGPYTFRLPEIVFYEPIGVSDANLNTFSSSRAPHWNRTGALTTVLRVTGTGATTTLLVGAGAAQNYLDVAVGGGANFNNGDYVVIDDALAGVREFMRVQMVQGDRLWFGSQYRTTYKAGLSNDHAIGATVTKVTTASVSSSTYSLDALTGIFTETSEIGDGELLATYTTDFEIPAVYPGSINNTETNGEDWGDWTGLPVLDGTYTFDLHGAQSLSVTRATEVTTYTEGADSTVTRLLFGGATEIVEVPRADPQSCYGCHNSLQFHGGSRRSLETCLSCHGTAGMEGRPLYEGGSAVGESVEFRHWLHAAHKEVFPAMPGGVQDCAKCHGQNTVWQLPAERRHPMQTIMTRSWMVACSSCHTDTAARAHMDVNTTMFGAEACAICHGTNDELSVINVHKIK
ncbi:MAG: hypothetical protein H6838_12765 [Planctomycetes bacterium]|nr:hypothetical protein [Planctomycetota bacterium]